MRRFLHITLISALMLMVGGSAFAADQIKIMGQGNGDADITSIIAGDHGNWKLTGGRIEYIKSTHTVRLYNVVASTSSNQEFVSNRDTRDLTIEVYGACDLTGQYIFDLDDTDGSKSSNLFVKSVTDGNLPAEITFHIKSGSGNPCAVMLGDQKRVTFMNMDIIATDIASGSNFVYGKVSSGDHLCGARFYNCYLLAQAANDEALFHRSNTVYMGSTGKQENGSAFFQRNFNSQYSTVEVTLSSESLTYDGSNIMPAIISVVLTMTYSNTDYTTRIPSEDYLAIYPTSSKNVGNYSIEIKGQRKCTGTITKNYRIKYPPGSSTPTDLSDCTVTGNSKAYTGSTISPSSYITVKKGSTTLTSGTDYTLTVNSDYTYKEAGIYYNAITITGKGDYTGTKITNFTINKDLGNYSSDFTTDAIPTQIYNGSVAANPTISVYDNGRPLTLADDYTVSYGTNTTEGTTSGSVTITGTGVYSGSKTFNFAIINEYFTQGGIDYHATSGETVAVGNKTHTAAIATTTTGIAIPASITHAGLTFQVTDIENGAFTGCSSLHYIDFSEGTGYIPTTLQRNIAASPFYGVPKQALVYLNGSTFTGENYIYKPGAANDYYCDVFKIYDDTNGNQQGFEGTDYQWEYVNIHPFTANIVLNTRQLTAGQHYTTCLPYPLPLTDGLKGYTLSASSSQLLGFKEVTGTLAAFHPYIVVAEASGQMLCAANVTVPVTTGISNFTKLNGETAGNYTLGGTLRYMNGTSAQSLYIMQSGNEWKRIDTNTGSYGGACVLPMRAYIKSGTSLGASRLTMSFSNAGGTTDIRNVQLYEGDAPILYDLLGRRIQHPRKGIYIHNGQKIVR